ncbi:hypothetical protein Hanom_Chr17g01540281 [Helianthus anomalus]
MNSRRAAISCCNSCDLSLVAGSPDKKAVHTLSTPLFTYTYILVHSLIGNAKPFPYKWVNLSCVLSQTDQIDKKKHIKGEWVKHRAVTELSQAEAG